MARVSLKIYWTCWDARETNQFISDRKSESEETGYSIKLDFKIKLNIKTRATPGK